MASESFEEKVEKACVNHDIPGVMFIAQTKDGKFRYEKVFGSRSLKDPSKPDPMQIDATMWLASCTKLVTIVAAMQCVERGQLKLDEEVTDILPELKGIKILKGFEVGPDGKDSPILVENTKPITLRHLLTHTSGLGYDVFNPVLMRYRATEGFTPSIYVRGPIIPASTFPLLFAPGESWEYSVGMDWAGWMVERVNGGISLEDYMKKNIWEPLGVTSICFYPKRHPEVMAKLVDMSDRGAGLSVFGTAAHPDAKVIYTGNTVWNLETDGCSGGAGGYGAPLDYHKLLHSLLVDDEKVLKKSTTAQMFEPQLNDASREAIMEKLKIPIMNDIMGGLPMGTKIDWGIGGAMLMQDTEGKKEGSMYWGGYPNLVWFIDRKGGMAGIMGSQINPPGDTQMLKLYYGWENEMYRRAGKERL